jgi:hypothetical protein
MAMVTVAIMVEVAGTRKMAATQMNKRAYGKCGLPINVSVKAGEQNQ